VHEAEQRVAVVDTWENELRGFDLANLMPTFRSSLGDAPLAVTFDVAGDELFVTHGKGSTVSQLSWAGEASSASGPLERAVPNALGAKRSVFAPVFSKKRHAPRRIRQMLNTNGMHDPFDGVFEFRDGPVERITRPPSELHATQAFALTATKARLFIPQVLVDPEGSSTFFSGYGGGAINAPSTLQDVAVLHLDTGTSNRNQSLFTPASNWNTHARNLCRLPRTARLGPREQSLFVACQGSGLVVEYDATANDPARSELRWWRVGAGPNAVAIDPRRSLAVTWSEFDRIVDVLAIDAPGVRRQSAGAAPRIELPVARYHLVEETGREPALAVGRRLFHATNDPRLSADGRACASCHPAGRDDGLSWRVPGQLAHRQTPFLAGRLADTAPDGWQGEHQTLHAHVRHTIVEQLAGTGLDDDELAALVRFIESTNVPSLAPRALNQAAQHGEKLFNSAEGGCANCHERGTGVDGARWSLGDGSERDTPSLRYLAQTAPFFHDGRYADIDSLLQHSARSMGQETPFGLDDRDALAAYLSTL
jgi:mono/diheme cytochrome c family protein